METEQMLDNLNLEASLNNFLEEREQSEANLDNANLEDNKFKIENIDQANYFLKRIKQLRVKRDQVNEIAKKEISKITDTVSEWQRKELNQINSTEEIFVSFLKQFADKEFSKEENKKKKSLKLPYGILRYKKQVDKIDIPNKNSVIEFLKENGLNTFIKVKEDINSSSLKKEGKINDDKLYINDKEIKGVTIIKNADVFEVK